MCGTLRTYANAETCVLPQHLPQRVFYNLWTHRLAKPTQFGDEVSADAKLGRCIPTAALLMQPRNFIFAVVQQRGTTTRRIMHMHFKK